ncbi:M20 family metallo-hydrolase [Guptibacillus spartinae]|uniref:M20 family metallo-hydrolase n=1 Tax=Guptibacillus spartinae TaxID=3025679 RepID=UPI002362222A|nr:M20 family metallo-hydrolase [Pseudalkalibacillus spartinae]
MSDMQSWLEKSLLALNLTQTMDRPEGFSRLSFTLEEREALNQFVTIAKELGLETSEDQAGNQWAIWQVNEDAPTVALGSHLDTVSNGGGYDGVAGVLSALAAVKKLKDKAFQPAKNIAVICFVSEESARFGVSTIGSKAISGKLDKKETSQVTDRNGVTIKQAVEEFGVNWETIEEAELPVEKLSCFLELHIEQGTQIEEHHKEVGIVNGVACPIRLQVNVQGMANHTGTTPMHRRQDALVAIAPLVNYVSERATEISRKSEQPLVATVSTLALKPNVMNVIPGEVELGIDIRSVDDQLKRDFANEIKEYCRRISADNQVEVTVSTLVDNDSVLLDYEMQKQLAEVCEELGFEKLVMNSGAGHDVMNMAAKWPSGLIFIPCKDGISHHPSEFASLEDIEKGVYLISRYIEKITVDIAKE